MFIVSSCMCLCPIHWSHVLIREWRCSRSSADRWCSNYIWVTTILLLTKMRLILEIWRYTNTCKNINSLRPSDAYIFVGKLTIVGSDNGLAPSSSDTGLLPGRCQTIIWTSAGILLIGPLRANFSETLIGIQTFPFKKMHWKCRLRNGAHFVSAWMC